MVLQLFERSLPIHTNYSLLTISKKTSKCTKTIGDILINTKYNKEHIIIPNVCKKSWK